MRPWLLLTILAVMSWGVWAVIAKGIGEALSPVMSQALSSIGLIPVIVALALSKKLSATGSRVRGILFSFGAGILTSLGNIAYYDALNRGVKATTVIPLTALYPLVTIFLAVTFLRERLNKVQGLGIIISMAAIYLFNVQSETGLLSSWILVALVPIGFWGVSGLLQKIATNHVTGQLSGLCFLLAFVFMSVLLLFKESIPSPISPRNWGLVSALGLTLGLGNLAILAAFERNGKAAIISPLAGLYPLVSIPLAMLFFGERIGPREGAGVILALLAVAALSFESPAPLKTN